MQELTNQTNCRVCESCTREPPPSSRNTFEQQIPMTSEGVGFINLTKKLLNYVSGSPQHDSSYGLNYQSSPSFSNSISHSSPHMSASSFLSSASAIIGTPIRNKLEDPEQGLVVSGVCGGKFNNFVVRNPQPHPKHRFDMEVCRVHCRQLHLGRESRRTIRRSADAAA